MNVDGSIVIGTVVDDGEFYKKIKEFEKVNDVDIKINPEFDSADLIEEITKSLEKLGEFKEKEILSQEELGKAQVLLDYIEAANDRLKQISGKRLTIPGLNDIGASAQDVEDSIRRIDMSKFLNQLKQGNKEMKNIGNSIQKVTKKVVKWGLAVIGIRSAYGAIRKAISMVSSNNEEIANTFKVMSVVVANTLTPAVQKIVDLIKILMLYINYIYNKLTGKNLFDFTKAFADANKSSASIAKNMTKATTGFDEMNVISDTSSGGSAGGMVTNPFEGWEDFNPPTWLDKLTSVLIWIKDNWKAVVTGLLIIGGTLLLLSLKSKKITELGTSFTGFFNSLGKGIEAIAILGGLALVIQSIADLITSFSQSGLELTDVLSLMGIAIGSIVVLITALTIASQLLQNPLAMGGLVLLVGSIVAILLIMEKTLPTILDVVGKFINQVAPPLNNILNTIGDNIDKIIRALGDTLPPIINSVGTLFEKIGNTIVRILNTIRNNIVLVLGAILNFINNLGPAINNFVDNAISAITKLINFLISGIEYTINTLLISSLRSFITKINDIIPGSWLDLKVPNYISIPRFVPRLAKGGIVNMPGRGVPVGNAITGERGHEGVIPLTDSQQMALLGEAIGKYININATIPVYVANRQVAREFRKINAEDNFAYNR